MKRSWIGSGMVLLALLLTGGSLAGDGLGTDPYGYHLRIVRVSGAGTDPGAALGWAENGGIPVTLPDEEAWGTTEQLDAVRRALGGERADPVTGFYVTGDENGARFDRRIYVTDSVVDLSFAASPPTDGRDRHLLSLRIDSPEQREPMAEARLLVRTDRTVAIATPSPVENDWLVLAVTLVDQGRIDELRRATDRIKSPDEAGVAQPRVIRKVTPRYPEAARKAKLQGHVVVMATIDLEGIPRAPMVIEMSPGAEELAAAAVEAVKAWRYEPATLDGRPVEVAYTITVQFRLDAKKPGPPPSRS